MSFLQWVVDMANTVWNTNTAKLAAALAIYSIYLALTGKPDLGTLGLIASIIGANLRLQLTQV